MERAERCGRCRFWPRYLYAEINDLDDAGIAGGDTSECRRRSPLVTGGMYSNVQTVWPTTNAHSWCGEFEPRPAPETPPSANRAMEREDGLSDRVHDEPLPPPAAPQRD